jgi:hypothetical protein
MSSLGPASAPLLQPLRLEDRESGERERKSTPRKAPHKASPKRDDELETVAELGKDEESHRLDERA